MADRPKANKERTPDVTDAGVHGDKIAASDPAAAPLITDAEASPAPTPLQVGGTALQQQEQTAAVRQPMHYGAQPQPRLRLGGRQWLLTGAVVALVGLGVLAGLVSVAGL